MKSRGFLNAFWLKIIMLVLMLFDHLYYFLFPRELLFAHYLARLVAPVFAYFIAQGMLYTGNRNRYLTRLFVFAAVMAGGNYILLLITGSQPPNNIFLSLAIGATLIYVKDKSREGGNKPICLLISIVCIWASFYCEGQYLVPLMVVIFYYLRKNQVLMYVTYIVLTGLPFIIMYFIDGRLQPQFYMIFAVFPLMLYNGERGPDNAFTKYVFYVFYPVHIWAIFLIKEFLR